MTMWRWGARARHKRRRALSFPEAGYYEVWARATDSAGDMQPFAINWNPNGYLNNSMHRVALRVA